MANFHNPYSKYPDFAGGMSDMMNQIMMMLMMKNMMGPQTQKNEQQVLQEPIPPANVGQSMYTMQNAQTAMPNQPVSPQQQQLMMMLARMAMQGR